MGELERFCKSIRAEWSQSRDRVDIWIRASSKVVGQSGTIRGRGGGGIRNNILRSVKKFRHIPFKGLPTESPTIKPEGLE